MKNKKYTATILAALAYLIKKQELSASQTEALIIKTKGCLFLLASEMLVSFIWWKVPEQQEIKLHISKSLSGR